jgi:predicted RNA-binding protein with PUA-like domain
MKTALEKLLTEETFEPYAFVMNSGDRYEVRNFSMAVREGDAITVYRYRSNRRDILRIAEICVLEILDPDGDPGTK